MGNTARIFPEDLFWPLREKKKNILSLPDFSDIT